MNAWRVVRRHYVTDPEAGREAAAQLLADLYGYDAPEDLHDARERLRDGLGPHHDRREERTILERLGLLKSGGSK
jgi:hypothetical protein